MLGIVKELFQDFRYGWRVLRQNPAFSVMAMFSLALGIGANAAIFSIFNGLFLGSLPLPEAERLVYLSEAAPKQRDMKVLYDDSLVWRKDSAAFEGIALFFTGGWSLSGYGEPVRIQAAMASYELGPTLGISPVLGRYFQPEECRGAGAKVALIGYGMWQRLFAGSSEVLGKTIHLDNDPYTVIGVLPRTAVYPADVEAWIPSGDHFAAGVYRSEGVGRLKRSVTLEQAPRGSAAGASQCEPAE